MILFFYDDVVNAYIRKMKIRALPPAPLSRYDYASCILSRKNPRAKPNIVITEQTVDIPNISIIIVILGNLN